MTTSGKENFRLKSYKNKSLNPDEMRRRREEEGLQLRKQKREEQVLYYSCNNCNLKKSCLALSLLLPSPFLVVPALPNSYTVSLKSESFAVFSTSSAVSEELSAPHSLEFKTGRAV